MFDPLAFKALFPLFAQPENQRLVYLDNAATSQRPEAVIEAVANFYRHSNANTHRSSHRLARQATAMVERTRAKAAQFLNARADELVFCRGATEALNLLAYSLCAELAEGDEIILSTAEHHANLLPWQMAAEQQGLSLVFLPPLAENNPVPDISKLADLINDKTRIVSITAASNAMGFTVDIPAVAKRLARQDIQLVVDAAQLAAHQTIDVQALDCDFLVCSAHKFYGPTGIGLLYGRKASLTTLPPWQGGGEMIKQVELFQSTYAEAPQRFETGTSSLAAIAGLEACMDFWQQQDRAAMHQYEKGLCIYLHQQLAQLDSIHLLSKPENNLGIAAFVPAADREFAAADLAHWLDEHDIALRVGHHCAMPLIDSLGQGSTLRASLAAYNTRDDIDHLVAAISSFSQTDANDFVVIENETAQLSLDDLIAAQQWQQRYRLLMKWGDTIQAKPRLRQPQYLVQGCESDAWLSHQCHEQRHYFQVDSDSRVVKGLAALLLVLIDGKTTEEIAALSIEKVFKELQMDKHLSPSRTNGFYALVQQALVSVETIEP